MNKSTIHSSPQKFCPVCNSAGTAIYKDQPDRLFGSIGYWTIVRCVDESCNTLWLNPKPVEDDLKHLYEEYYTHADQQESRDIKDAYSEIIVIHCNRKFSGNNTVVPGFFSKWLSYFLYMFPPRLCDAESRAMSLPVKHGGRLLEVGFGNGDSLQCLSKIGWKCEGIDFDQQSVDQGKALGLSVKVGGIEDFNFAPDSFDAIVSQHVVEHLYDVNKFLIHCSNCMKEGGDLVIYTPNANSLGHKMFKKFWRGLEVPRHLQVFSLSSLERTVTEAGFKIVKNSTTGRGGMVLYESLKLKLNLSTKRKNRIILEFFNLLEWGVSKLHNPWGEEIRLHAKKVP